MRIKLMSVFVEDQGKALAFYSDTLGFVKKMDFPVGDYKWLTLASPEEPEGTQLLLEPRNNPTATTYVKGLRAQGIPSACFFVDDIRAEHERLKNLGVTFTMEPTQTGPSISAIFDDSCGNIIQITSALRGAIMDAQTKSHLANLYATDRALQNEAYEFLLSATDARVAWAYEAWDELVKALTHADNHLRSIAGQLLCRLAKSDPEARIVRDFPALLALTHDERFVTARHVLQSLWRIGFGGPDRAKLLRHGLERRFAETPSEKNGHLTRSDIIEALARLHGVDGEAVTLELAQRLIAGEAELASRKKLLAALKLGLKQGGASAG